MKKKLRSTIAFLLTLPLLFIPVLPSLAVTVIGKPQTDFGKLLFKFQVLSDPEVLASDPSAECNLHFDAALSQIESIAPDSSAVFIPGDVVNRGTTENWQKFRSIVDSHTGLPKIYCTVGNHDVTDNGTFAWLFSNFKQYSGMEGAYYDTWINNFHFIAIGQEDSGHNKPLYTDAQFKWLEEKLAEKASLDKPIFLFSHYSIRDTSAGTYLGSQIGHAVGSEDKLRLMALLEKYPQIIYFTGHTHFALTDNYTHFNIDAANGNGADMFCAGATTNLYDGSYEPLKGEHAQFDFVEVYERGVKVKGWDVINEKWIDSAEFSVDTTSKVPTQMAPPKIELSCDTLEAGKNESITAYITYEDTARIYFDGTYNTAWVGLVSSDTEGFIGDTFRWVMVKNLPKDAQGRFIWNITDDCICESGSKTWAEIMRKKGKIHVGLFDDTLYLGHQPTVPSYSSKCYDPYARVAKNSFEIKSNVDLTFKGSGTKTDPYRIENAEQFAYMMDCISIGETYKDKYIIQTCDLDFTDITYYIVESPSLLFDGTYDGRGYKITNLSLSGGSFTNAEYNGVFGIIRGTVMNVGVENTTVQGTCASGLVRKLIDGGKLLNSYSRATVNGKTLNGTNRGTGLADYMTGKAPMISNCYFAGTATGNAVVGSGYNAVEPVLDNVFYQEGSAKGSTPIGTAAEEKNDTVKSQTFVDRMNTGRAVAAKSTGLSESFFAEWTLGGDGYPTLIPIALPKYKFGDVNGDGEVDVKDAVLLAQHLAQWNVSIQKDASDVNCDGVVDVKDAVHLAQYLAKWDITLGE